MNNFVSTLPKTEIAKFCQHWKIQELALFGSVLRHDFNPDSDLDLLITFSADADWGLLDHVKMQQELQVLLGRNIDLISKRAVERSTNWLRRNEILKTAQILFTERKGIYAAG